MVVTMIPVFIPTTPYPSLDQENGKASGIILEEAYHRPDIKKIRQKYAWITGLLALFTTATLWLTAGGHDENFIGILFTILLFVYLGATFVVYLIFHQQMKELKNKNDSWARKPQVVMVDTQFRSQKLAYSNYWFAIPFLHFNWNHDYNPCQLPADSGQSFRCKYSFSGESPTGPINLTGTASTRCPSCKSI